MEIVLIVLGVLISVYIALLGWLDWQVEKSRPSWREEIPSDLLPPDLFDPKFKKQTQTESESHVLRLLTDTKPTAQGLHFSVNFDKLTEEDKELFIRGLNDAKKNR